MNIKSFPDYEKLSQWVCNQLVEAVKAKPDLLLCCATGDTLTRSYEVMGEYEASNPGFFSELRILQFDEWVGLDRSHPGSCVTYLKKYFQGPLNMADDRLFIFEGKADDPERMRDSALELIEREGPIDICTLGLGTNGHLGFNEPAEEFTARTHIAALSEEARNHSAVADVFPKPDTGVTLGVQDILDARCAILAVSGAHKKEILKKTLEGPVDSTLPATVLLNHPNAIVAADSAALAGD